MTRRTYLFALLLLALTACHRNRSIRVDTREKLISVYTATLKHWDKDGDGRLSRTEVEAMVDAGFRRIAQTVPPGEAHPELQTERLQMIDEMMAQDADKDGYLSPTELLKKPLAGFSCADADHDGKLSKSEERTSMERCDPPLEGQPLRRVW